MTLFLSKHQVMWDKATIVLRYIQHRLAWNSTGIYSTRALDAHKEKAHKVQRSIRITQQNAEACYANGIVYNKVDITSDLLEKISEPMQCPIATTLDINKLHTYSFTDLEKECKLHCLKYRKSKSYCLRAIKDHYCSGAHNILPSVTPKIDVKEEEI